MKEIILLLIELLCVVMQTNGYLSKSYLQIQKHMTIISE